VQKILKFAGVKDIYSKTKGQTKTQLNLVKACISAFKNLNSMKVKEDLVKVVGLTEGRHDKDSNN